MQVTNEAIESGKQWVQSLQADGGTNLNDAYTEGIEEEEETH